MRKIAVVTGSRADYWLLRPLLKKLQVASSLILFVTGEHINRFGIDKIKNDQFHVSKIIDCLSKEDSHLGMTKAIAQGIEGFGDGFAEYQQDITILLGDRYEIFAAACASYSLKIPIAHIHGGEITYGAIDDGFRHAITKMSSLHFVSHIEYEKRLIRMGEPPQNVYTVGALGLDNLDDIKKFDDKSIFERYAFLKDKEYFLLTLHSSTLSDESIEYQVNVVMEVLDSLKNYHVIITQANTDPGGIYINKMFSEWSEKNKNIHFVPVLGDDYLKVAFYSKMVIGNSSSGVLEIPYLNRPVINIGNRQEGRILPKGVYSVSFEAGLLKATINRALDDYAGSEKIYGVPGQISQNIFDVLTKVNFNKLIYKRFHDE